MERKEQLKYCRICRHRRPDLSQGMLCGITGLPPAFEETCELFEPDSKAVEDVHNTALKRKTQQMLAGKGTRFANFLLDWIFLYLISIIIGISAGILLGLFYPQSINYLKNVNMFEKYIVGLILGIGYYSILEGTTGRSLAKFITRTRVVDENGGKASFGRILLRSVTRFIPFEPFSFLGNLPDGWHDRLSGTMVIRAGKKRDAEGPLPEQIVRQKETEKEWQHTVTG